MGVILLIVLLGLAAWRLAAWLRWRKAGRPDSLRWAFARYLIGCVAVAVGLCGAALWGIGTYTGCLKDRYYALREEERYVPVALVTTDGTVVGQQLIGFGGPRSYADFISSMPPGEAWAYRLMNDPFFSFCLYTGICAVSVAVTSVLFYRRRLKAPLEALDAAAGRIAAGDLDFTVAVPGKDELARLGTSFETMRGALAQANRTLWRTLEEERRVQAAFAHDLRTPLTVLKGYDELLLKYGDAMPPEKRRETLQTMHGNLERLEGYTARMGRVRSLEALEPRAVPTDLAPLCASLADEGRAICAGKAFALQGCGGSFLLDAALLREVFENLAANAARHAANRVTAALAVQGQTLALTVQDDGPGFSAAALAHAADAFWRDEAAPDAARGAHSGLGLYICRALCQKHGGTLTLANGESGGARVTATFARA